MRVSSCLGECPVASAALAGVDPEPAFQQLNTALQAIIEDGTYKTINDKYFPFSIY